MKFAEFPPKDIVRLLLSFVYIERYPLNFVRKLFNPYFLDRIHDHAMEDVHLARHYLTLFDVAMNIDSPVYGGKSNFFSKNPVKRSGWFGGFFFGLRMQQP